MPALALPLVARRPGPSLAPAALPSGSLGCPPPRLAVPSAHYSPAPGHPRRYARAPSAVAAGRAQQLSQRPARGWPRPAPSAGGGYCRGPPWRLQRGRAGAQSRPVDGVPARLALRRLACDLPSASWAWLPGLLPNEPAGLLALDDEARLEPARRAVCGWRGGGEGPHVRRSGRTGLAGRASGLPTQPNAPLSQGLAHPASAAPLSGALAWRRRPSRLWCAASRTSLLREKE